jgi:hypothetical protein
VMPSSQMYTSERVRKEGIYDQRTSLESEVRCSVSCAKRGLFMVEFLTRR